MHTAVGRVLPGSRSAVRASEKMALDRPWLIPKAARGRSRRLSFSQTGSQGIAQD